MPPQPERIPSQPPEVKVTQANTVCLNGVKDLFSYLLFRCQDSRFLPLLPCSEPQWWQSGIHPCSPFKHPALQPWQLNSDQASRKDCQPESAADQTSFHLSLSLTFPCPDCLLVFLPPERWYHFISKIRAALQARHRLWPQGKRH